MQTFSEWLFENNKHENLLEEGVFEKTKEIISLAKNFLTELKARFPSKAEAESLLHNHCQKNKIETFEQFVESLKHSPDVNKVKKDLENQLKIAESKSEIKEGFVIEEGLLTENIISKTIGNMLYYIVGIPLYSIFVAPYFGINEKLEKTKYFGFVIALIFFFLRNIFEIFSVGLKAASSVALLPFTVIYIGHAMIKPFCSWIES